MDNGTPRCDSGKRPRKRRQQTLHPNRGARPVTYSNTKAKRGENGSQPTERTSSKRRREQRKTHPVSRQRNGIGVGCPADVRCITAAVVNNWRRPRYTPTRGGGTRPAGL